MRRFRHKKFTYCSMRPSVKFEIWAVTAFEVSFGWWVLENHRHQRLTCRHRWLPVVIDVYELFTLPLNQRQLSILWKLIQKPIPFPIDIERRNEFDQSILKNIRNADGSYDQLFFYVILKKSVCHELCMLFVCLHMQGWSPTGVSTKLKGLFWITDIPSLHWINPHQMNMLHIFRATYELEDHVFETCWSLKTNWEFL